jgi:hypothetical protein
MVFYIIILLCVGLGLFWLILTQPAQRSAALLTNGGPLLLMALGCVLTLFRRGVIGLPLIFLGLSWWRRNHSVQRKTKPEGRKSTVRSASLEMELDHDTGEIDGRVLTGPYQGARLSSLTEEELLSLYREISSDTDSVSLLTSFLDRVHPDWRERVDPESFGRAGGSSGFAEMTEQEAYQILGLEPGASQQEIHQAWRRLIKAVHPDHGGSPFLSAKINAARDLLLD